MRLRLLGSVLIAGLVAFAGPAWSQGRGGGHGGSGHSSGGGHSGSGGHQGHGGHGGPGGHPHGNPHPGFHHHFGGHFGGGFGWRGFFPWGGLYFGLPLWWNSYWWWGWPYGYYGYYGSPDAGIATVPADPRAPETGSSDTSAAVSGPTPVDMEVSPPSALVYLNGVLVGSVDEFDGHPDYLYLEPGQYTVDLRMPGYRSKSLKLNVGGENKVLLSLDLQADPAASIEPANPPSPGLPYGNRFGPSFGPATSQASPPPADSGTVTVEPAADSGSGFTALGLRVSPPGAAVYFDGVLLGTGESLARLPRGFAVSPGAHRIEVVAPGHAGKTIQVTAEAGKKEELSVTLE